MEISTVTTKHREAMRHVTEADRILDENGQSQDSIEKAIEKYSLAYEIEAEIAKSLSAHQPESNWRSIACLSAASLAWRCGKIELAKDHIGHGLNGVKSYITKDALEQLLKDIDGNVSFFSKN